MKIASFEQLGWVADPVLSYPLGRHSQTALSVEKATTSLAAYAYLNAAIAAIASNTPAPNRESFISQFEPWERERADFKVRQSIRYINTVWVYEGFIATAFAGIRVLFQNVIRFLRDLIARILYWGT